MVFFACDGAAHRLARLKKALQIALSVAGLTEEQGNLLIKSLSDDKGRLVVVWAYTPSNRQRHAFADAWGLVGEKADSVLHRVGE